MHSPWYPFLPEPRPQCLPQAMNTSKALNKIPLEFKVIHLFKGIGYDGSPIPGALCYTSRHRQCSSSSKDSVSTLCKCQSAQLKTLQSQNLLFAFRSARIPRLLIGIATHSNPWAGAKLCFCDQSYMDLLLTGLND